MRSIVGTEQKEAHQHPAQVNNIAKVIYFQVLCWRSGTAQEVVSQGKLGCIAQVLCRLLHFSVVVVVVVVVTSCVHHNF